MARSRQPFSSQVQLEPKLPMADLVNASLNSAKEPKAAGDGIGQGASGFATAVRGEAVPVEGVVPDLGSVVEDATSGGLDDLFQRLAFKLGTRHQVVQVDHVGVVVLAAGGIPEFPGRCAVPEH